MPGNMTAGEVGALLRAHLLVGRPSTAALLAPGQYRTAAPGAHVTVSLSTEPNRLSVRGPGSVTDLPLLLTDVPAGKVRRVRCGVPQIGTASSPHDSTLAMSIKYDEPRLLPTLVFAVAHPYHTWSV
jgi:hypothetical protein